MGSSSTIPMLDPKGNVRLIPDDQADAAQKAGGKRVVKMMDPKGTARWIASDQQDAALKAGGKLLGQGTPPDPNFQTPGFFKQAYQALTTPQAPGMFTANAGTPKWLDQVGTTGHNVTGRAIAGVAGMVRHPLDTLKGTYDTAKEMVDQPMLPSLVKDPTAFAQDGPIHQRIAEFQQEYAKNPRTAIENLSGDMLGIYMSGKLLNAAGKPIKAIVKKVTPTPEGLRNTAQTMLGAGRRNVSAAVKSAAGKAEERVGVVQGMNQAATERTLRTRGAIDKANDAAKGAHVQKTVAQLKEDAAAIREASAKRSAIAADNALKGTEHRTDVEQTLEGNRQAAAEHKGAVETTLQAREGAEQTVTLRQQAEEGLRYISKDLAEKVAAAEAKAEAENNTKWKALRETNSDDYTTSAEPLQIAVQAAIPEADPATSALFRSILKHRPGEQPVTGVIEPGAGAGAKDWEEYQNRQEENPDSDEQPPALEDGGLTFGKLQGWRTYLNKKMTGNLDGNIYHAYQRVLRGIDSAMDDITKQTGTTEDLKAARAGHRQLKETFSDSPNAKQTVASKALTENTPAQVKAEAQAARLKMLARYDPTILHTQQAVQEATEHLAKFATEDRLRKGLKQPPDRPAEKDAPDRPKEKPLPELPTPRPLPEASPPKQYGEPAATKPIEIPELNTREMREKFIDNKMANWTNVSRWQIARLVTGPLGVLVGVLTDKPMYEVAGGIYSAAEMSPFLIQKMLDKPGVREWITRPPADELETLKKVPNADRVRIVDGLNQVVKEAKRQGKPIPVSPTVAAFLATGTMANQVPTTAGEAKDRVRELQEQTR